MTSKYFPIQTDTACPLKWNWSTLYLNSGVTRSCHRTAESRLTPENFDNFHNTEVKLADRNRMLNGQWPEHSCGYCRTIEESGGVSDRQRQLTIPYIHSPELTDNLSPVVVSPTLLEVYFSNACNLGCLYCGPELSSTIAAENVKFGKFDKGGIILDSFDNQIKNLAPYFWKWFDLNFHSLSRLHVLGGEPFYQKEFDRLLIEIEKNPNPGCELNIVSNLMISKQKLEGYIDTFKKLLSAKKIKRIDITCSIDCWGPQQEYVRWGLDLTQWKENLELLLKNKWLYISINQTISALTIKTMPELLIQINEWKQQRQLGHWFGTVTPGPSYMKPDIFGNNEFACDAEKILKLMPTDTNEDLTALEYMKGIFSQILSAELNQQEISKLITYLDEKDQRRKTQWETLFPWLIGYRKYVV
jgi:pyruvate-formate lyase-activating enzyme